MIRRMLNALVYLFPLVLLAPAAQADATLTMKDARGNRDAVIEVKGRMMRMSTPGEPDYLLYDAGRDVAIHVRSNDRQYMEFDRAGVTGLTDSVAEVQQAMAPQIAMMRERLKNLPPEQRAMIEKQMGGMVDLGAMEARPVGRVSTIKRGTDTIAGFKCQKYDVMEDTVRIADVCVATDAAGGLSKTEFSTLSAAMKFMRDMANNAQKLSTGLGGPQISMGDVEGMPVFAKDIRNGHEYRLEKVSDAALDDARFNAYRSLSKRDMPKLP